VPPVSRSLRKAAVAVDSISRLGAVTVALRSSPEGRAVQRQLALPASIVVMGSFSDHELVVRCVMMPPVSVVEIAGIAPA
jgi:hypothetical protein